jgi:hypothetical protein
MIMANESEGIGEETMWPILRFRADIYLERLNKIETNLSCDI